MTETKASHEANGTTPTTVRYRCLRLMHETRDVPPGEETIQGAAALAAFVLESSSSTDRRRRLGLLELTGQADVDAEKRIEVARRYEQFTIGEPSPAPHQEAA